MLHICWPRRIAGRPAGAPSGELSVGPATGAELVAVFGFRDEFSCGLHMFSIRRALARIDMSRDAVQAYVRYVVFVGVTAAAVAAIGGGPWKPRRPRVRLISSAACGCSYPGQADAALGSPWY